MGLDLRDEQGSALGREARLRGQLLRTLVTHGAMCASQLSARLLLSVGEIESLLKQLESDRWVERLRQEGLSDDSEQPWSIRRALSLSGLARR